EILETEAHDIQRYWQDPENGSVYEREICLICGYVGELGSEIKRPYSYAAGSEYELKILVENGYFASLDNDITITSPVLVARKEIVEIELNGFDLIANNPDENGKTVVFDVDGGTLGIYGEGNVIAEGNSDDTCIAVVSSGTFFTTEDANNLSSTGNYVVIIEGDTGDADCIIGSATVKATGDNPEYIKVEESEHATSAIVSSGKFYNWNPSEYTLNDIGKHVHMTESVVGNDTIYQVETWSRREGEKVAPTCTEQGYSVKICSDPNCNDVFKYDFVDALGHTEAIDNAVAPTCTATGLTQGKHCSVCEEILVAQQVVNALGHTEVVDNAVAPTCTTTGLTEGKHCSVCGETLIAQEVVDALGHTEVTDEAVAPTCTETGLTEGKHCSVCDTVLVARETIDALGHKASYTNITETNHTFVCTRENCGYTALEEHIFLDTGACSACKYQEYVFETNEDGTLSVVGAGKDFKAGAVTFPETFSGKSVTGITGNNAFINNDYITSITIPDSYTFISNQAFDNCSNLTSVQFGTNSKLKMIDYYAFNNCENLSSIKIPASVNTIGLAAFANCPNLTTVEFEAGTNLKVISQDLFADCTGLQSIVIPSGIEKIDISAFNGCSGLERIYIPTSLTTIEQNAFYECTKLADVCYAGSADEWANRVVVKVPGESSGNINILNARIHFNSDQIH
ncbi:MAG: leucine-rich repeat protein, partial [Clostridia bacterium]|nr:leucine-rich repeat protein [Clostridia bacterium]